MSLCVFGLSMGNLLDKHPVAARVLVVGVVFLAGYAEAAVLKSRGVASVTWFLGLVAASVWIAYPVTPDRLAVALGAFLSGTTALIVFYTKRPKRTD